MQSYTVRFHIEAPPRRVWRVLHPPVPPNSPRPRVLKWPTGSMEILNEGDEAGEGLVRTCIFEVPKYLMSGGKGRSWETVTEAKINKISRYVAVGKPLWSRAEGYHELEEQPDGTTVLTFHETYFAFNPVLRFLLERPVHAKISRDNLDTYEHALGYAGRVTRLLASGGRRAHPSRGLNAALSCSSLTGRHRMYGTVRSQAPRRPANPPSDAKRTTAAAVRRYPTAQDRPVGLVPRLSGHPLMTGGAPTARWIIHVCVLDPRGCESSPPDRPMRPRFGPVRPARCRMSPRSDR